MVTHIVKVNVVSVFKAFHDGRMFVAWFANDGDGFQLDVVDEGNVNNELLVRITFKKLVGL